jgi:hypothetical protein
MGFPSGENLVPASPGWGQNDVQQAFWRNYSDLEGMRFVPRIARPSRGSCPLQACPSSSSSHPRDGFAIRGISALFSASALSGEQRERLAENGYAAVSF